MEQKVEDLKKVKQGSLIEIILTKDTFLHEETKVISINGTGRVIEEEYMSRPFLNTDIPDKNPSENSLAGYFCGVTDKNEPVMARQYDSKTHMFSRLFLIRKESVHSCKTYNK